MRIAGGSDRLGQATISGHHVSDSPDFGRIYVIGP